MMRNLLAFAISTALIPSAAFSATSANLAYDEANVQTLPSVVVEAEAVVVGHLQLLIRR